MGSPPPVCILQVERKGRPCEDRNFGKEYRAHLHSDGEGQCLGQGCEDASSESLCPRWDGFTWIEEGAAEHGPAGPGNMSLGGGTGQGGVTWEALSTIPEDDQEMSLMGSRRDGERQKG